jgi:hypothetical protein
MMKIKIVVLGMTVLILMGLSSCDQWLTIKPESQILLDEYWKSETDVQAVLAACYKGLTTDDNIYRMIVWGELRSDNLTAGSGIPSSLQDMQKILDGNITPSNGYCNWGSFYTVINYCNTLLYYAPQVTKRDNNFTQAHLQRVQAEALTLRALSYFYLVRTFKEVPWIEDASIDNTQNYARPKDTEQTIINNIIRDLLIAQKYAINDYGSIAYNKGLITLDAVNSLLADVYLWNQQYDLCAQTCDLVLANTNLKLVVADNMFTSVFYQGNSPESIFELQFKENVQFNNPTALLYGSATQSSIGYLSFPIALGYNIYAKDKSTGTGIYSPFNYTVSTTSIEGANDIRATDFYRSGSINSIFKYAGASVRQSVTAGAAPTYFYRSNSSNWIVYRLSDVMLMKAEALVELDGAANLNNALSMVNQTYLRSNPTADSLKISNYTSKYSMEQLVLRERQRELLFEGKRWFDLVRVARRENSTSTLNNYINHKISGTTAPLGAPVLDAMYMPILDTELQANPNMVQNPFYTEISTISN